MPATDLLRLLPPLRRVARFRADPVGVQRDALRSLLTRAADTEFGRRHGFAAIARSEDPGAAYRANVPLGTPERLHASIERMRAGEADVLWPGRVTTFVRSTGTTGEPKVLPCTDETLRQWMSYGASTFLSHVVATGDTRCLRARTLSMAGSVREDPAHPGTRIGDISALAADHWSRHRPLRRLIPDRDLPRSIRELTNLDEQLDAACDFGMDRDVRILSMAPSWALMLFERLIERAGRKRGARLETVGEIWPNLRIVICGGVPLATYRDALRRRIGIPDVGLVETYGASESLVAFQERPGAEGMLLDLGLGTVFEFVPLDAMPPDGSGDPARLGVGDVRVGERYVPVVSTPSGLWACPLGDVVRFTSTRPHELVIEGRTSEMVDSYSEKVTGEQAQRALDAACAASGCRAIAFHLVPRPAGPAGPHAHRWLVEFDAPPAEPGALAMRLDERLGSISATYSHCRAELGLGAPQVELLRPGALRRALERVRGGMGVQGKVPRTSDRLDLADAVSGEDRLGC